MNNTEKKDLYIFGCSGIAKSLIDSLYELEQHSGKNLTMVDKDENLSGTMFYRDIPVIGINEFKQINNKQGEYICAFFKPYDIFSRLEFCQDIEKTWGLSPITVIDKKAHVSVTANIGLGVYIAAGVVVDADACIRDHSIVLFNSIISRECILETNNFISASVVIKGSVYIGANNFVSSNCVVTKNIGTYNFINSGIVLNRGSCDRMLIGLKTSYLEMDFPSSDASAEKKLRFLNP